MGRTVRTFLLATSLTLASTGALRAQADYPYLGALTDVLSDIRLNYPDSVGLPELVRAAIGGMLRSLDPHSYFLVREDFARRGAVERGELGTTGLTFELVQGRPTVLGVLDGSPAARARVQPGDWLLTIDDTSAAGLDVEHLQLKLAGERGSRVRLRFARGTILEPDTLQVTLKRESLPVRGVTVTAMADSVTGSVRLAEVTLGAGDEVDRALRTLKGRGMRRAVLDLRGDPGGLIIGAIDVAGLFLPRGTLVFKTRTRRVRDDQEVATQRDGSWLDLPLIVLIDDRSASASEALAGSLQDNDRALIVGRRSFGKALIQRPFVLETGDVVWLTIGRVLTPSGRFIQRRYEGIEVEQYYAFRGTSGDPNDTAQIYPTRHGRPMRGGGGIAPDLEVPGPARLPVWFSVAADSAYDTAVADSVAQALPTTPVARQRWLTDSTTWAEILLPPFLMRTRTGLKAAALPDSLQAARMARILALRVAEVRWGADAGQAFALRNDPDLRVALSAFQRLPALLAPTRP
ncbi:MAG TPA: S41 family peptidase [Gemmatimonadales bacterium]